MDLAAKILILVAGVAIGWFASLGYSYRKTADAVALLPAAAAKMDAHAELDMALLIRAMRLSKKGLHPEDDADVLRNLADYYHKRSQLTEEERHALGCDSILKAIEELSAESPVLRNALDSGKAGS